MDSRTAAVKALNEAKANGDRRAIDAALNACRNHGVEFRQPSPGHYFDRRQSEHLRSWMGQAPA